MPAAWICFSHKHCGHLPWSLHALDVDIAKTFESILLIVADIDASDNDRAGNLM